MRDLDLVVSVAHRGGVDPEATASTVEMRAALVRETCELLGIDNVELQPTHAIDPRRAGQYSVHLGSAGVMLLPGTALPDRRRSTRSTAADCSCRSRTTIPGPPRCSPRCCCSPATGRSRTRTFWNGFAQGRAQRS